MSGWQGYIDNLKQSDTCGHCPVQEAAIWGILPGQESVWASSEGFPVSQEEIKKLLGDRSNFRVCGPTVGGKKCMLLTDRMDEEGVYCLNLKTRADADGNTYNLCVGKAKTAFVIAQGTKDANGGELSDRVFKMVKYLRDRNM